MMRETFRVTHKVLECMFNHSNTNLKQNFDIFANSYDRASASNASSAGQKAKESADPSTMDGGGESAVAPKPKRSKIDIGDSTSSNGASDSFTIAV